MSQKNVDKTFKNGLGNYVSEVDEDQLWSAIEDRVPKKQKRRKFFIWFLLGIPFLFLLKMGAPWNQNTESVTDGKVVEEIMHYTSINTPENREDDGKGLHPSKLKETPIETGKSNPQKREDQSREGIVAQGDAGSLDSERRVERLAFEYSVQSEHISLREEKTKELSSRIERNVIVDVSRLTGLTMYPLEHQTNYVKLLRSKRKRTKRIKPQEPKELFLELNYFAGMSMLSKERSMMDGGVVNYGDGYFSQGISLSVSQYFNSSLYGRVILQGDKTQLKYMDKVVRDTIVPTSSGQQIIAYNEYSGGVIDTELGIPMVNATYTRELIKLNSYTSISAGLGLGYRQAIGKWNLNLEVEGLRSIYDDFSGIGREEGIEKIEALDSFKGYFSDDAKYMMNINAKSEFGLSKEWVLTGGFQYQYGFSSLLENTLSHKDGIQLLRFTIGVKKAL